MNRHQRRAAGKWETVAMRRVERSHGMMTPGDRELLDKIAVRVKRGDVPSDVVIPHEPGKVSFSVELGSGTLNWNMDQSEIDFACLYFEGWMPGAMQAVGGYTGRSMRDAAKDFVLYVLRRNLHLSSPGVGTHIASAVTWMVINHESIQALGVARDLGSYAEHAGYIIMPEGGDFYRWRLALGRSTEEPELRN
jgi:hypothetical protein